MYTVQRLATFTATTHQVNASECVGPVEAQGDLRLIAVEVVAADTGDSLHVSVVLL